MHPWIRVGLVASAALAAAVVSFSRSGSPALPLSLAREARAQPAPAEAGVTGPGCVLKGAHPLPKGTQLFDAPAGGRVVATFTGASLPLVLSDVPADAAKGRARLATSHGGSLRIEGYVPAASVAVFTARDIAVVPSRVWISSGQGVQIVGAAPGSLTVELAIAGSQGQTARAAAPCEALALEPPARAPVHVPGNARGYVMRKSVLDLYDSPGGSAVFTLRMTEGAAQLFWSTEARAGFVHVMSRGDLSIDAWVRQGELEALKKGEMMDQVVPPTRSIAAVELALDKPPPLVRATKELPVRARRDAKEKPIGAVEVGAEVYLLETVAGWTNLLPKHLGLQPGPDGGFWIPSAEVPK